MTKITKELVDNYLEANPELAQDKRNADFNAVFLPNDVSAFGISAFANCIAMHAIRIPSEVSAIESSCFINCKALSSIDLPSISAVEAGTFKNCQSLQKIELPETISAIKENAFQNCENLISASFNSVLSIEEYGIDTCNNLAIINIPSIKQFGASAIVECDNLLSIVMSELTEVPQINGNDQTKPWDLINPDYKVYVNADIRDTMANTGWWKNIADKIIAL